MTLQTRLKAVVLIVLLGAVVAMFYFSGKKPSQLKNSGSKFLKEIQGYAEGAEKIDIWSGKIRAFEKNRAVKGILIEGKIEKGDFKRFTQVVASAGPSFSTIYLFSPGGNAVEAMKIGSLIRKVRYQTWVVPMDDENGHRQCFFKDVDPKNCTCESACFLVYIAGISRMAHLMGVHRVYLDHSVLREFSGTNAMSLAKSIKKQVSQYLREMGTPEQLMTKLFSTPSNEMRFLQPEELELIKGNVSEISEWISAKCLPMTVSQARETLRKNRFNMKLLDHKGTTDQMIIDLGDSSCRNNVEANLSVDGWNEVFKRSY